VKPLLVGLDLGTSALKAGLYTTAGEQLALQHEPYPLYAPQPGWAEQAPEDWWEAAVRALNALGRAAEASGGEISAIGLCGQCPGHVLVDANGESLGRALIWRDRRAVEQAGWLASQITLEQARRWTGTDGLGDVALPPARLLWLKAHQPQAWQHTRAILQPKDYLALRLTGELATDLNSAFCLANPGTGRYEPEYFAALDIPLDRMPRLLSPRGEVGRITAVAAAATGLRSGLPVVTGTIDAFCDLLGSGAVRPGQAVDVAGTSEMIALATDHPAAAEGVYAAALDQEINFVCGPTQTGGEAIRWLARGFYPEWAGMINFAALEAEASTVPPGSQGLIFLPYLEGERAPIWDAQARAAWVGLTSLHTRAHCARAVYEGVAFSMRHVLERCESAWGFAAHSLTVCGGGAVSDFWNQLKADVLNRPVLATAAEAACLGAALLAAVSCGLHGSLADAAGALVRPRLQYEPRLKLAAQYEQAFRVYKDLYPALRPTFQSLARVVVQD
jgi:xylulokinase